MRLEILVLIIINYVEQYILYFKLVIPYIIQFYDNKIINIKYVDKIL